MKNLNELLNPNAAVQGDRLPPPLREELKEVEKKYEETINEARKMMLEVMALYAKYGVALPKKGDRKRTPNRPTRNR